MSNEQPGPSTGTVDTTDHSVVQHALRKRHSPNAAGGWLSVGYIPLGTTPPSIGCGFSFVEEGGGDKCCVLVWERSQAEKGRWLGSPSFGILKVASKISNRTA